MHTFSRYLMFFHVFTVKIIFFIFDDNVKTVYNRIEAESNFS